MEGKRSFDDAGPAHDSGMSNGTSSRNYSPRLPTPDASRSSDASYESHSYVTDPRRGPAVADLLTFRAPETRSQASSVKDFDRQSSSREGLVSRSPPYQTNDDRKPLLPPLKMVIANAMNSPPETPRADGASLQPSPREPSVSSSMFKPLAFYPNKKARTEDRPQWQAQSLRTSPTRSFATYAEHNSASGYTTRRLSDPSSKRQRRYSMHSAHGGARCCDHSTQKPYYTFTGRPSSSGVSASTVHYDTPRDRAYDRFPISPSSDIEYIRQETAIPHRAAPFQHHSETSRPHYAVLPVPSPEYEQRPATSYRRHMPEPFRRPSYEQPHDYHHREHEDHSACRDNCHANQAAFFMPPHYDYSQGKSRKRSNLPKQSTEIMKTWFDNNIANPYPSEEQKATFSNLTGISMTQVSNWFINHRRRCPELREKRERVRTGGLLDT